MSTVTIPFWQGLIMSEPRVGKSTFLAGMPKPLLVDAFDPPGKLGPYFMVGLERETVEVEPGYTQTLIYSKKDPDRLLIKLRNFVDFDPENPTAFQAYETARTSLRNDIIQGQFQSYVIDSLSLLGTAAFYHARYALNPDARGEAQKQWYGYEGAAQQKAISTALGLPCHSGVAVHVDDRPATKAEKPYHGELLRGPSGRGQMGGPTGWIARAVGEIYFVLVDPETGERVFQTQPGNGIMCGTDCRIDAPNGMRNPRWADLWANFQARYASITQPSEQPKPKE